MTIQNIAECYHAGDINAMQACVMYREIGAYSRARMMRMVAKKV